MDGNGKCCVKEGYLIFNGCDYKTEAALIIYWNLIDDTNIKDTPCISDINSYLEDTISNRNNSSSATIRQVMHPNAIICEKYVKVRVLTVNPCNYNFRSNKDVQWCIPTLFCS